MPAITPAALSASTVTPASTTVNRADTCERRRARDPWRRRAARRVTIQAGIHPVGKAACEEAIDQLEPTAKGEQP